MNLNYSQPLFPALLIFALASALLASKPWGRRLVPFAVGLLVLVAWPPFACLALLPFEGRYLMHSPEDRNVDAIVVLSSDVYPPYPPLPTPLLGTDTYERCAYAAWLYKNWHSVPVLATGGGSRGGLPYAITMRQALEREGVPENLVWAEEQSQTTFENAAFSAKVLRKHGIRRIALVTEAFHMLRAEQCFRKQGFEVVSAACGFRIPIHFHASELVPTWEAIAWNEDTLHEAIGLLWYKLSGKI